MLTFTAAAAALASSAAAAPKAPARALTAAREEPCLHNGGTARRVTPRDSLGPGLDVLAMDRDLNRRLARLRVAVPDQIVVPVRFHVLSAGKLGRLTQPQVETQIATLNAAYGGLNGGVDTGVRFLLVGTDYSDNQRWFAAPGEHETQFKAALHTGGAGTLNLYSASVGQDVLGFSTFPQWQRGKPGLDGVVIDYRSLPDGPYPHFDLGYTGVHEIGHWLGLFHTFENGCASPGDAVADTPAEEEPTEGCPPFKDSCPAPGADPVHNYMDYAWDDCMSEFTPGQAARIRKSWTAYRSFVTS